MNHGVYISENDTQIVAASESYAGLPVVIGTSSKGALNEPQLVHTYKEAVDIFGASEDFDSNTLNEFIYSQFVLYAQSPAVLIRVAEKTAAAVIGGYDAETGKTSGLELVGGVYHKFGVIPGIILCPGMSHLADVASVMRAKAESVSGVFKCVCICDAVGDKYTEIAEWKTANNHAGSCEILCWPKVRLGGRVFNMSTHLCGVMTRTDSQRGDIPYKSPSNELLQTDGAEADSSQINLTLEEANYLNGQGIVTMLNWAGSWRIWGNRTSIYPSSTDPKECFIPVRRMFNFIGNTFITTFWQEVDQPITVRLIRSIVNSFNLYMNGLSAREYILGGSIEFREDENPKTALIDGRMKFHIYITPPVPAESIEAVLEYDPENLEVLYDVVNG